MASEREKLVQEMAGTASLIRFSLYEIKRLEAEIAELERTTITDPYVYEIYKRANRHAAGLSIFAASCQKSTNPSVLSPALSLQCLPLPLPVPLPASTTAPLERDMMVPVDRARQKLADTQKSLHNMRSTLRLDQAHYASMIHKLKVLIATGN